MALNIQVIDMHTDDFSPAQLYGYDKYKAAEEISYSNGYHRHNSVLFNTNPVFREIFKQDRIFADNLREELIVVEAEDTTPVRWQDFADMTNIPEFNHLNIMTYQPVRRLAEEGRITGFGYDPASIPEDIIGRMISNGKADIEEDGSYTRTSYKYSDDLDLSDEILDGFEKQREMIDLCLEHTNLDPTDTTMERF